MALRRRSLRTVALALAAVVFLTFPLLDSLLLNSAQALEPASEPLTVAKASDRDRARVADLLSREDVRRQMEELGIDPDEATLRASSLSDDEIRQIASVLNDLPSDRSSPLAVVAVAIAFFVVLIVTELLGYTNVFAFLKAGKRD